MKAVKSIVVGLMVSLFLTTMLFGLTNFPNGVSSFGMPVLPGDGLLTTGKVFFVSSSNVKVGSNANSGTEPDWPMKTIGGALAQSVSGRGDVIYVMPRHIEYVATNGGLAVSVPNVKIIGLGVGTSAPKIALITTLNACVSVNAASVLFENIVFEAQVSVNRGIDVTSTDFGLKKSVFQDASTAEPAKNWVTLEDGSDRAYIVGNRVRQNSGANSFLVFIGADDLYVGDNDIQGNYQNGNLQAPTVANIGTCNAMVIAYNVMKNSLGGSTGNIVLSPSSNGIIAYNALAIVNGAKGTWIPTSNSDIQLIENYGTNLPGVTGRLIGVAAQ